MTQLGRVFVELVALGLLIAGIAYYGRPVDGNVIWGLLAVLAALGTATGLYVRRARELRIGGDIELFRAALWTLIRDLENNPTSSSGRRGKGRIDVVERFAAPAQKLGRPLAMGGEATPDMARMGIELIELNEKDGSGHWRKVNGIRRGCTVFLTLLGEGNTTAAFLTLTEHAKVQARLPEGATPNLTELKMLFGLPIEWPEKGLPERLEQRGLHWRRAAELAELRAYRDAIFAGVRYTPFPRDESAPDVTYTGADEIMEQMRVYIR